VRVGYRVGRRPKRLGSPGKSEKRGPPGAEKINDKLCGVERNTYPTMGKGGEVGRDQILEKFGKWSVRLIAELRGTDTNLKGAGDREDMGEKMDPW